MRRKLILGVFLAACGDDGGTTTGMDGQPGAPDASPTGGPTASAGPDRDVIGGLVVPLDASGSVGAASYAWALTDGPGLAIEQADQPRARVAIPADAAAGTAWVFTVTVTDAAGMTDSDTVSVTVHDPVFESAVDPAELGTTEGIAFLGDRMYVISMGPPGWISTFDPNGDFVERIDVGNRPVGANFDAQGRLVIGDASDQALIRFDPATGMTTTLASDLGPANYPLPDRDGNVYVTNRTGGQIWRWDAATQTASVFAEGFGTNPNALAFGPEEDVLYAGTIEGVWRIPLAGGPPEIYVDNLDSEVDGLAFDIGGNLFVGCPNTGELHLVPYVQDGPSAPARSFQSVGGNVSLFTSATFGEGPFGEDTLYWTNLGDVNVGKLHTGLPGLDPPLRGAP